MDTIFLEYLFEKRILVNDRKSEHPFEALFAIANKFGIKITEGRTLAHECLMPFIEDMLGDNVPTPFYLGFPETVKNLSSDKLLFDQLYNYFRTYDMDDFSNPRYSVFEEDFDRIAFREKTVPTNFIIVTQKEAQKRLAQYVEDMLAGTRPLSSNNYEIVLEYVKAYSYKISKCACKDTAIRLYVDTGDLYFARFLKLSDVIKVTDYINFEKYGSTEITKLNLKNKDRKIISALIKHFFEIGACNVTECFEKKALWSGLLHHIHYKPTTEEEKEFLDLMRGRENRSVYSAFEREMESGNIKAAVDVLVKGKGAGALMRKLTYILSRCKNDSELDYIIENLPDVNAVMLIQMLFDYSDYKERSVRTFKFTKHNMMKVYTETTEDILRRKSHIPTDTVQRLSAVMREKLKARLAGKLGKVYITPDMYKIAVPISEASSQGGLGVLPKGSRLPIPACKKIRGFTYWEKVNDIDLSVIGITDEGAQLEFSWRTMYSKQSSAIAFSGDQVSGYDGGSEYYDIDVEAFKKSNPNVRYLVFCNNVFSQINFGSCYCTAGYMIRDIEDSGEVFEPKTVRSSFVINCPSTFAYLFGIDLRENELVWLNAARDSAVYIAGTTANTFLSEYFTHTQITNLGQVYEYMASEVVATPDEADLILSDGEFELAEGKEQVHSYDIERTLSLLN